MAEELIAKYFKKPSTSSPSSSGNAKTVTIQPKKKKENKMIKLMVLKSNAKNWSIGKVLDKIAIEGKIKNMNNQLSVDDPEVIHYQTEIQLD
ncbi:8826_t:CDS:2 [Diversispora eburnea]|uniref:8826_t:CDS:1 n=1 Tax=Diversispora eburnea TaxID=1213867 RepID=A0A9N8Z153_9GLOM|nr:8826_t:CDS:2 [Diversispora eburnea]